MPSSGSGVLSLYIYCRQLYTCDRFGHLPEPHSLKQTSNELLARLKIRAWRFGFCSVVLKVTYRPI